MTTYNVPYTFIPGTKAKANEVNENFIAILNYISELNKNSADINFSNLTETAKETIYNNSAPGRLIGEIVTSTIPITDACVHLLDGAIINGDGIYKDFVEYIGELYGNGVEPPSYFTTEENWQTSLSNYNVCGKFVYNSAEKTVRLPKITGIIEGTVDINALGALVEAGLPNITGTFANNGHSGGAYGTGAFVSSSTGIKSNTGSAADGGHYDFNASRSSKIYGKSQTVQPQTIKQFVYIVIANSKKTDVIIDIDNLSTDLNNKADTSFSNISPAGQALAAYYAMPSNKYIALTLGASLSEYTAPANGWIFCSRGSTSGTKHVRILQDYLSATCLCVPNIYSNVIMPICKGQKFKVEYTAEVAGVFRFIYAKGSESEV